MILDAVYAPDGVWRVVDLKEQVMWNDIKFFNHIDRVDMLRYAHIVSTITNSQTKPDQIVYIWEFPTK